MILLVEQYVQNMFLKIVTFKKEMRNQIHTDEISNTGTLKSLFSTKYFYLSK